MSATHYIATAPTGGPEEVTTIYRVGVWAVHASEVVVTDLTREHLGSQTVNGYVLTHAPSGMSVSGFTVLDDATAAADMLGAAHGEWATDAPWGDPAAPYWTQHEDVKRDIRVALAVAKMVRLAARHAAKVTP